MSNEDFPALPGTQNREGASPATGAPADKGQGGGGDGSGDGRCMEKSNSKNGELTEKFWIFNFRLWKEQLFKL